MVSHVVQQTQLDRAEPRKSAVVTETAASLRNRYLRSVDNYERIEAREVEAVSLSGGDAIQTFS